MCKDTVCVREVVVYKNVKEHCVCVMEVTLYKNVNGKYVFVREEIYEKRYGTVFVSRRF